MYAADCNNMPSDPCYSKPVEGKGTWTKEEHDRFAQAMLLYPKGPWKSIAQVVKTRSIRQVQTHAQKYREKLARRNRGLKIKQVFQDENLEVFDHPFFRPPQHNSSKNNTHNYHVSMTGDPYLKSIREKKLCSYLHATAEDVLLLAALEPVPEIDSTFGICLDQLIEVMDHQSFAGYW
jgi:SHAQKYF class myb-like DNA-binding protein